VSSVDLPALSADPTRPRALPSERVVVGAVRFASRVGDQLLVLGWHAEQTDRSATELAAGATRVDSRHMALPHAEPVPLGDGRTGVATGFLAAVTTDWPTTPLLVRLGRVSVLVTPDQLFDVLVDVRALAWEGLGGIDAEQRKLAAAFLAGVASPPGNAPYRRQVAQKLHAVHQTLREALPAAQIDAGVARGLFVDQLYAVDEQSFYVRGWVRDADAEVTRLVMVSPEGSTADILPDLARYPRPDVAAFYAEGAAPTSPAEDRTGFLAAFTLDAPSRLGHGWKVELHNAVGDAVEAPAPEVITDPAATRTAVLNDLAYDLAPDAAFLRQHAEPALSRLVAHRTSREEVTPVHAYGAAVPSPDVTCSCRSTAGWTSWSTSSPPSCPTRSCGPSTWSTCWTRPSWPSRPVAKAEGPGPDVRRAVPAGAAAPQPRLRRRQQRRCQLRQRTLLLLLNSDVLPGPAGLAVGAGRGARPAARRRRGRREAALRGRLAAARRHVLRPSRGQLAVDQRPLLQGPAPQLPTGLRRAGGARGDRRLPAAVDRALERGRRAVRRLRAR
jgi:hypothetical protein